MIWIRISYNTELFFIQPLLRIGQKNVQIVVGFFEYGINWYFAFGIYWPLNRSARGDVPQTIYQLTIFFFQFKKINHANSILSDEKKRSIYDKHGSMGLYLAEQFGEDFVDTFMTMQSKWFQCCILSIFCLTGCCFCKSFAANFA